jgi:formylglycine-generating enzyme required for sulfatase activity
MYPEISMPSLTLFTILLLAAAGCFARHRASHELHRHEARCRIEAGTFKMGQDGLPMEDYLRQKRFGEMHKDFDRVDFDEKPAHEVTISQPFFMGVTEVTVAQFRQFDPDFKQGDPKSKPGDDDAASGVTWEQAVAFCALLSKKEGRTYRLPTEGEWNMPVARGRRRCSTPATPCRTDIRNGSATTTTAAVYFPPGPMPREYDCAVSARLPRRG